MTDQSVTTKLTNLTILTSLTKLTSLTFLTKLTDEGLCSTYLVPLEMVGMLTIKHLFSASEWWYAPRQYTNAPLSCHLWITLVSC